ncbi:hypothetical protein ACWGI0_30040 [Streptomyces sp. NPDC054802]
MTDQTLESLRNRPDLAEIAAFPFGFDLDRADHCEDVRLASGASLEPVAGDDTGGTFFVCGGGPVLYASSEGQAGLLGDTVGEALEIVVGLDDLRERLRAGLGLPERSPAELIARLHAALLRTDPGHVLLNADELMAYELLDTLPRTALRDVVLAPGRAALERLRSRRCRRAGDRSAPHGCRCSPARSRARPVGSAQRSEPGTTLKRTQTTSVSSSTACPTLRQ